MPSLVSKYVGRQDGQLADPDLRRQLTQFEMNAHAQRITQRRAIEELQSRAIAHPSAKADECAEYPRRDELLVAAMGPQGFRWDPETADAEELASLRSGCTKNPDHCRRTKKCSSTSLPSGCLVCRISAQSQGVKVADRLGAPLKIPLACLCIQTRRPAAPH